MIWLCLLFGFANVRGQFVEVETELEVAGYFNDAAKRELGVSVHRHPATVIFGTNTWLLTEPAAGSNAQRDHWLFADGKITHYVPGIEPLTFEAKDGNPCRPVKTQMELFMDYTTSVNWYAFCSSQSLNQRESALLPPHGWWKWSELEWKFDEEIARFKDPLGLPRSIDLRTTNGQPVFQYRVAGTTNFAGWTIPVEFHVAQYQRAGTNSWQVFFTAKGKVKSIRNQSRRALRLENVR